MDPLSALLLAVLLTSLGAKTVLAAATDAIAVARGKTPPSQERWQARQKARAARGEAPEKDPGPVRRWWRNAVEEHNVKAAQKHQARMELLDENADANVARHKDKLRKRAERWDRVGAKISKLGSSSWDAAKNAAATAAAKTKDAVEKAKEAYDEHQAWKENERRSPDPAFSDSEPEPEPDYGGPDAEILPFRRPDTADSSGCTWLLLASSQPCGDLVKPGDRFCPEHEAQSTRGCGWASGNSDFPPCTEPRVANNVVFCAGHIAEYERRTGTTVPLPPKPVHDSTTTDTATAEGNTVSDNKKDTVEINDLDSAIAYCEATVRYTSGTITSTLGDLNAQLKAALDGLAAEATDHETALASIADEGFREKITGRFTAAIDALTVAVAALKGAQEGITAAEDQTATATSEMRSAKKFFEEQKGIAENVNAAKEDGGVAKRTAFYA